MRNNCPVFGQPGLWFSHTCFSRSARSTTRAGRRFNRQRKEPSGTGAGPDLSRWAEGSHMRSKMARQSVYIETTVLSYLTSKPSRDLLVAAHQHVTAEWWESRLPLFEPFISPLVIDEISRGDKSAATLRLEKIQGFAVLEINDRVRRLADLYFDRMNIPEKARGDAYHLAVAAFHGMDFLVTWNFGHILNPRVRIVVQNINTVQGISTPIMCTPEELMEVEHED